MGTWGSSLLCDDDAQDVYHHYRRLFNEGKSHAEVLKQLRKAWSESLDDPDDGPIFWLAVARAQWEFGDLDAEVLRQVEQIVEKDLGMDRWREAGPKALARRQKVVRDFLEQIRQPNPKPKQRKGEKKHVAVYQVGDCLAVKLCDGSYGAALVIAVDNKHATEGIDVVGLLDYHGEERPPLAVFEQRRWAQPAEDGPLIPVARKVLARSHRGEKKNLETVGRVKPHATDAKFAGTGFIGRWKELRTDLELLHGRRSLDADA